MLLFCNKRWMFYRPDGEKKAYVRLAPDYDALDVANKVRSNNVTLHILYTGLFSPFYAFNLFCPI